MIRIRKYFLESGSYLDIFVATKKIMLSKK